MKLNETTLKERAIANKSGKKSELVTRKIFFFFWIIIIYRVSSTLQAGDQK